MKASENGGHVPRMVGEVAYSRNEDGDSDGCWRNSTTSLDEAIAELANEAEENDEDVADYGYVADCVEAVVDEFPVDRVVEYLQEQVYDMCEDDLRERLEVVFADLDYAEFAAIARATE